MRAIGIVFGPSDARTQPADASAAATPHETHRRMPAPERSDAPDVPMTRCPDDPMTR
jgi:hypothetical protein